MPRPGTKDNPLRVAIIGAGPAGFFTAEHLFKQPDLNVEIDMFERLPTPYGLVRAGVAPDHQKIKSITKNFDRIAGNPNFRYYGYVEFGKDISMADIRQHYHQVVIATGAQTDRQLRIPGEELEGCHGATEFVAWYNGHPDYRECRFDLSQERVAIIGVGNVALDVARILCRTPEELEVTDIADYALDALRQSHVREVYLLGRRGVAQAAFTNAEIKEMGELSDCDVLARTDEVELDPASAAAIADDKKALRKVEIVQGYAQQSPRGKSRRLFLRFLISPVEILGDEQGRVCGMQLVRNELYQTKSGTLHARPTDLFEDLDVGLIFRSVGYRGVPLPGVEFNNSWGTIPHQNGRVIGMYTHQPVLGVYTTGWIKRGPSGVIGTNKGDAKETVEQMMQDLQSGMVLQPEKPDRDAVEALIRERQPNVFTYTDWLRLNEIEVVNGQKLGRPRLKLTTIPTMLSALEREHVSGARKKILLPTDFSRSAEQALIHAVHLAKRYEAEIHLLNVIVFHDDDPFHPGQHMENSSDILNKLKQLGAEKLDEISTAYTAPDQRYELKKVQQRGDSVDGTILKYAEEEDIDLIVMGTHGRRGMNQLVIGSIADKIVRLAPCPVMTVLEQKTIAHETIRQILVPIDFSNYSRLALTHAKKIAADYNARLQLLHVVQEVIRPTFYYASDHPPALQFTPQLAERATQAMQDMLEGTVGINPEAEFFVTEGHPRTEILDFADRHHSDLIVIATHGLSGFENLLLGSTTGMVVRRAKCPVFTVKAFGKHFI